MAAKKQLMKPATQKVVKDAKPTEVEPRVISDEEYRCTCCGHKYKKQETTKTVPISTLNSWAETFSNILGIPVYWHSLRHFFTTSLAKANLPDSVIKTIIGWESLNGGYLQGY